ncbi:MAG: sigma 54-interacting transcriptional regulator [Nitrospirae bacterium]|nr:sigma 54-interacting transcriptional regulator [Nitrospirota bacterium]
MLKRFLEDPKSLFLVLENIKAAIMVTDPKGNIVFFNRAAEEITGYSREDVRGKSCAMLDTDTCAFLTETGIEGRCNLFRKGFISNKKCRINSKDGRFVHLLKNASVIKGANGEIIGAIESMTDITSLYMKAKELEELKQGLREEYWFMGLLGKSASMQRLYEQIRDAATSEAPVLMHGETGTGKNLAANAIHKLSRRKEGPFIHVNCPSFNEYLLESELFGHKKGSFTGATESRIGRFEAANKGTIFLDEIGDMPLSMQAKLLKVLEEKVVERVGDHKPIHVDVRIVSATNKNLDELVAENKFREDLLYRINSIVVRTPPLRERIEDMPMLILHYLKKASSVGSRAVGSVSPGAMKIFENYDWPGNVRQLINAIEHCTVTCKGETIDIADMPGYVFPDKHIERDESHQDRERILSALNVHKGNRGLAASHLGISRVTLWKRLKNLGIE